MKCEFELCIFNEELTCGLEEVNINVWGMCDDCIIAELDDDVLRKQKERHFKNPNNKHHAADNNYEIPLPAPATYKVKRTLLRWAVRAIPAMARIRI